MNKVISFPENKMTRVKRTNRLEARNAIVTISAASFLMMALFINDSLSKSQHAMYVVSDNGTPISKLNRAIASAEPMNVFRDIEWEKKMAKKLGLASRDPAAFGKAATPQDQLKFGTLGGKYFFSQKEDLKVSEIRYIESQDSEDHPIFVEPQQFLTDNKALLAVTFEKFDKVEASAGNIQDYRLINQDKKVVGTASFTLDEDGRFLSLRVSSN